MLAIVAGTMSLILVLSVFNGFESLVKSLYSSFYTDLKIVPASGKTVRMTPEQLQMLTGIKGVKNYSLVIEEKGLLQNGENQSVVFLKGVDDNYRYVTSVEDYLVKGDFNLGTADDPRMVLGAGVEGALGIQADMNIYILTVYLPRKTGRESIDPMQDISSDSIRTSSAFMIQQDFDNKYAITNIAFTRQALGLGPDQYSGVEIAINNAGEAEKIKDRIATSLGSGYKVLTRYEQNEGLYAVMNMERWIIYGVLCLVLIVAAFTMIGALTMLVLEKQKDISVLHALGSSRQTIRRIFLSEGLLLALAGGAIGMVLALIFAFLQINFHLIPLQGGSFLINYFPVELRWTDFLLVGATVFVIAAIASWIPAAKAARQPFSLRSE